MHSEPADISRKVIALRELICQGLADEVRLILLGASSYNALDDEGSQRYPSAYEAHDEKGFHLMTFVIAHLERAVGGRGPSYPDEFERWLSDGAPGINLAQVDALRAHGTSTL